MFSFVATCLKPPNQVLTPFLCVKIDEVHNFSSNYFLMESNHVSIICFWQYKIFRFLLLLLPFLVNGFNMFLLVQVYVSINGGSGLASRDWVFQS